MEDLARAYAVLGLEPDAAAVRVKRRYRALVKTWHPDRYAADLKGQAEAGVRMREINSAYSTVVRRLRRVAPRPEPQSRGGPGRPQRAGLSREEIDAMVRAIGSEGPVDAFLAALGRVGGTFEGILVVIAAVAFVVRFGMIPLFLAVLAFLGVQEYF